MRYLEVAEKAAKGSRRNPYRTPGRVRDIDYKGKNNLVTEADKLSEDLIVSRIKETFHTHDIFAEESGRHSNGSDHVWLIDPLDGTTNYAHAYPFFAVSIALEIKGS